MRKIALCFCALMCSVFANAQGLGDYMEIDSVPGFVFYLDETGEHGLVMSFYGVTEKKAKKAADKAAKLAKKNGGSVEDAKARVNKVVMKESGLKNYIKERKKLYPELVSSLGTEGEQNALAVSEFCNEKGLSLQDYFPEFYWASQLGEGWFIPGENEITRFAEFYAGGIGEENKVKGVSGLQGRRKDVTNDAQVQDQLFITSFYGLKSSSMKDGENGFLGLARYTNHGMTSAEWFQYEDRTVVGKAAMGMAKIKKSTETIGLLTVAVHKF